MKGRRLTAFAHGEGGFGVQRTLHFAVEDGPARFALLLIAIVSRVSLFTWLGVALLVFCYYRTFSRNISKRTEENYKFYTLKDRVGSKFRSWKEQWANRKVYHYYRCPQCRQKLRVPRGRGRIQISCPRCGTQFIKKS